VRQQRQPTKRVQRGGRPAKRQRNPYLFYAGVGLLVLLLLGGGIALAQRQENRPLPGEPVPIQGAQHIQPGESHPSYNSDPPTSGWHYELTLPAGFYEEPEPDELLVHNLEHGHIVISYDCSKLADCEGTKNRLRGIFDRFDGWKVTIVPRQNADAAIALTAWGRIDKLDDFDEQRIVAFIRAWRDRGPERTAM
jgi:hypothetical protein